MTIIKAQVRAGAYYDSAFLMQMQRSLGDAPGIQDAGVIMGTDTNKELLARINLVNDQVSSAKADDLVIVVRAYDEKAADAAFNRFDELLTTRKSVSTDEYRPQSVESAVQMLPDSAWVLVSVAGRYAASVARDALRYGKHVFLFSDNVSVEEEIELKKLAAVKGLLVMGADCGTAIIRGIGLGFANKVRLGPIGLVAAAGTGLQQVSSRIHQLGSGMTYGIGTGGRDLSEKVGAITFKMGLDLLDRDPNTKVIVLVSKPPAPSVADDVIKMALNAKKPVVVNFIARPPSVRQMDNLYFASGLDDAARIAVELAGKSGIDQKAENFHLERFADSQRFLRGLYSGGTLAYEAQYILKDYLPRVYANAPIIKDLKLPNSLVSQEHCVIDLGEDEFTVGRLHPMMDNELRIRRLIEEANDPTTAVVILDVVIGYGSHPDPASELAPAISEAKEIARKAGRYLEVLALVTGTDEDPQDMNAQIRQLKNAGAVVETDNEIMTRHAGKLLRALNQKYMEKTSVGTAVDLAGLERSLQAINVGLESFHTNLLAQGAQSIWVDWRPPAGGNEKLMGILQRMKKA